MTFTEAAVEVLKLVGKPLHYKKIAEIAIERNLLSHVGKTPEVTMSARLTTMVKKDRGDAPILKVKPGVFGLRDFSEEVLKAAETASGHDYELPAEDERPARDAATTQAGAASADAVTASNEDEGARAEGSDPEDDDMPILGGPDEEDETRGRRRRRSRRRKRRGEDEAAPPEAAARSEEKRSRGRERSRERSRRVEGEWSRTPAEGEPVAHGLADAVAEVLASGSRRAASYGDIARRLVRKNVLSGEASGLAPTVAAAVRSDIARQRTVRARPRFRAEGGQVSLVSWSMPSDALRAEADAQRAAERQREAIYRAFLRRLERLPMAGFAELVATWLNAEGVMSLRAVRPPGGTGLHLAGSWQRGADSTRLAVAVYRSTDLGRDQVIALRGAAHHYDSAGAAWMVTTGQVQRGAIEEATSTGTPPVSLFDGTSLASAMEAAGVGLERCLIPVVSMDDALLESLGEGARDAIRAEGDAAADTDSDESDEGGRTRRRRGRRRRRERPEDEETAIAESASPREDSSAPTNGTLENDVPESLEALYDEQGRPSTETVAAKPDFDWLEDAGGDAEPKPQATDPE